MNAPFIRVIAPKMRIAFTLHELEGHPLAEVAELMEATVVATKTRVFRARQRIDAAARKDPVLKSFVQGEEDPT
jgi:DNA-directed RNA polymerase specialized sigma24 family protein